MNLESEFVPFVLWNMLRLTISIGAVSLINLNLMERCGGAAVKRILKPQDVESKSIFSNQMIRMIMIK